MKIGIITFYNGNINHGGMLQAYALQRTIENLGYDCEQICLDNRVTEKLSFKDKVKYIQKWTYSTGVKEIKIATSKTITRLPGFTNDIYKGMKENKKYTLKELGL